MTPQVAEIDSSSVHSDISSHEDEAVVIVTPYSTGCLISRDIASRGYKIICLWNQGFSEEMKKHQPKSCDGLSYFATLSEKDTLKETIDACHEAADGRPIVAVVCGGEAGVDLCDELSEKMGLLSNGTDVPNRRDKKVQQDLIKEAGLRSTRQAAGNEFSQVEEFLRNETYPVIVKPVDSAGSDGVELCHTFEEAKAHFLYLTQEHELVNGGACCNVLCQEYLKGKEYVVDSVSLNGEHKTMMVWLYDKRPVNGGSFVYFADIPQAADSAEADQLIPYAKSVLDALGVKHGPSHGEFILTEDGPCLVEMNCRMHGGDGIWSNLCRGLTGGYNQVDATVSCYLEPETFAQYPEKPGEFKTNGLCVDLVSFSEGIVKDTPGYHRIKLLPSFVHLEANKRPGSQVYKTVDMVTDVGCLILMHHDRKVLEQDIDIIRALERANAMFEFEPKPSNLLERKLSVPKEEGPLSYFDAMPPSMYLERKLSVPKEDPDMYVNK